jgi:hypothetical protein
LKAKPPARSWRQTGQPVGAPVPEQAPHVGGHLVLSCVELRRIADPLLALEYLRELIFLGGRTERDVPEPW